MFLCMRVVLLCMRVVLVCMRVALVLLSSSLWHFQAESGTSWQNPTFTGKPSHFQALQGLILHDPTLFGSGPSKPNQRKVSS